MATIKDVAKLAKVAVSTASNALNGKYGVKPETKRRVLEAARQLNYVPNPIAQGLVTKSTRNIGMVLSGPSSFNIFTNSTFFEMIKSITLSLNESGYHALLNIVSMEKEMEEIPRIAKSRSADALILIGTRRSDEDLNRLLKSVHIPALLVVRGTVNPNVFAVSTDNVKCGYIATRYLLDMGHRIIGFIGTLPGVSIADERHQGYRMALEEAGISYDETLVVEGDFYQESGLTGLRQLLRQASKRPTAIFAANDMMALGAMEAAEQEGLRIPEDISLIGCDNIPNLHLLKVPLTTIAVPFSEIGRLAARKLIGILEGNDDLPAHISLNPELRVRGSVKSVN